jgi:hypothetical protein
MTTLRLGLSCETVTAPKVIGRHDVLMRAVFAATVLLAVACSGQAAAPEADVDLRASFVQQRIDEGTSRAHIRLTNEGDDIVHVSGIGLAWPGYGERGLADADTDYEPGHTIDLPIQLSAPECAGPDSEPVALVEVDDAILRLPLDHSGTTFLREVWQHACDVAAVRRAVSVRFGTSWRRVADAIQGTVELDRASSEQTIAVNELLGSVLLDFVSLTRSGPPLVVLRPGEAAASLPVALTSSGRCDAHALSESKQTFLLRVALTLDGGEIQQVIVSPDKRTQVRVLHLIRSVCGVG